MFDRLSRGARAALFCARYCATVQGASEVTVDHLLAGLLADRRDPGVAGLLVHAGIDRECLVADVESLLPMSPPPPEVVLLPFDAEVTAILHAAVLSPSDGMVPPVRLFADLLACEGGLAADLLATRGLTAEEARRFVEHHGR